MKYFILLFLLSATSLSLAQTSESCTVHFKSNKAEPISGSIAKLDSVLAKHKDAIQEIIIEAHADSRGAVRYNLKLSEKRGNYVYNYLVKNGIDSAKLKLTAWGKSKPLPNSESLAMNRRVGVNFLMREKQKKEDVSIEKMLITIAEPKIKLNTITSTDGSYLISSSQDTNILVLRDAFFFEVLPNTFENDSVVVEIDDYLSAKSIIENNLSTASGSSFLVSKGMFQICFSEPTKKTIRIRVPCSLKGMQIYETKQIEDANWKLSPQPEIQVDETTGECFDVIEAGINCLWRNYDVKPILIQIKVKRKYWKEPLFTYCFNELEGTISMGKKYSFTAKHFFGVRQMPTNDSLKVIFARDIDGSVVTKPYLLLVSKAKIKKKRGVKYWRFVARTSLFRRKDIENYSLKVQEILNAPLFITRSL